MLPEGGGDPSRQHHSPKTPAPFLPTKLTAMTYANYADVKQNKPFRWWYDAIIDWMLTHPGAPLRECAAHFGKTQSYLSVIINSDMFKARLAARRAQFNEELGHSVQRRMLGALDLALEVVTEQLETKRTQIPFKDTSAFVNSTLERLGYGAKPNGAQVTVNVGQQTPVQISASDLQEARELLRRSEAAKLIEATPLPQSAPEKLLESETLPDVAEDRGADAA